MGVLSLIVEYHHPAVPVLCGDIYPLTHEQLIQQTAPDLSEVARYDIVVIIRRSPRSAEIPLNSVRSRWSHCAAHVRYVIHSHVRYLTDAASGYFRAALVTRDDRRSGSRTRPLGSRSSLSAVGKRTAELSLCR